LRGFARDEDAKPPRLAKRDDCGFVAACM